MKYKAALFDLDGTLLDTLEDLADSVNFAIQSQGYAAHPLEAYRLFVGDGLKTLVKRAIGAASEQDESVQLCSKAFIEEYSRRWKVKTKPYAGIVEALQGLRSKGLKLGVLSNKPHDFTLLMVRDFFPDLAFASICGAKPGIPLKPAPDGALAQAAELGLTPQDCLFVGDSGMDMRAASAARMNPVGVLWGFRGKDELLASGAKNLLEHPSELLNLV